MFQDELRRMSDEKKLADQKRVSYEFGIDSENIGRRVIGNLMSLCDEQAREGKDSLSGLIYYDDEIDFRINDYYNDTEFVYDGKMDRRVGDYVTATYAPRGKEKQIFRGWDDSEWRDLRCYCISSNKAGMESLADAIKKRLIKNGLRDVSVNVKSVNIVYRRMCEKGLFKKQYITEDTIIATGYRIYIDIKW